MIYQAKKYKNRKYLDSAILANERKDNDIIQGKLSDLSNLSLSESCNVYGVKVKVK